MIHSMTGYGVATQTSPNYKVTVELKSLNSKYLEFTLKLPRVYMKYEHKVKNELARQLGRGKITMLINVEVLSADKRTLNINKVLVKKYYEELNELVDFLSLPNQVDLPLLLELPEVIPTEIEHEDLEEWELLEQATKDACQQLLQSRTEEGMALDQDLAEKVKSIGSYLEEVEKLAPGRLVAIRKRLEQSMDEIRNKVEFDPNRFEQELIYYLEKLDINEEIVRLRQHLKYFEELRSADKSNGKQLQFLSQEMGREINTIGSKANDAQIQRNVVKMKDHLEKIKEQVLNIV